MASQTTTHQHRKIQKFVADPKPGGDFWVQFADGHAIRGIFQPGQGVGIYTDPNDVCSARGQNAGNPLAATAHCPYHDQILRGLVELAAAAGDPVLSAELTAQAAIPNLGNPAVLPPLGALPWVWDSGGPWRSQRAKAGLVVLPTQTYVIDPSDEADIPAPMPWFDKDAVDRPLKILETAHKAAPGMPNSVVLFGESGTGKSTLVKFYASQEGVPYARITMSQFVTARQLFGKEGLNASGTVAVAGFLPRVLGRPGVVLVDEINRSDPSNWSNILQLLELEAGEKMIFETGAGPIEVVRHPQCLLVFAMNEGHKHAGLFELGEAFNRRNLFCEVKHTDLTFTLAAKARIERYIDHHETAGGDVDSLRPEWDRYLDKFSRLALAIRGDDLMHEAQDVCPEDAALAAFYAPLLGAQEAYEMKFRGRLRDPFSRSALDSFLATHPGDFSDLVSG